MKTIISHSLLLVFCLLTHIVPAQEEKEVSAFRGNVIDNEGQPVPYAYVFVDQSDYGTFSNRDGEFNLFFESFESGKDVIIQAEGYESTVQKLEESEQTSITLKRSYVVASDKIHETHPEVVVENILTNVEDNYPDRQLLHKVFFREYEIDAHKKPFYITELMIDYLRENYHSQEKDKFKMVKGRIYMDKDLGPVDYRHIGGGLSDINNDVIKYPAEFLDPVSMNKYEYSYDQVIMHENKISTFKIKFTPLKGKGNFHGYLYVQDKSFALVKAEIFHDHGALKDINQSIKSTGFHWKSVSTEVNYKKNSKEKYYLSDIVIEAKGHHKELGQDITSYTELFTVDCESAYFFANEFYNIDEVNALDDVEYDNSHDFWEGLNHIPIEASLMGSGKF